LVCDEECNFAVIRPNGPESCSQMIGILVLFISFIKSLDVTSATQLNFTPCPKQYSWIIQIPVQVYDVQFLGKILDESVDTFVSLIKEVADKSRKIKKTDDDDLHEICSCYPVMLKDSCL
jgi:hypothetical protein